jgi:hypothetical protein
MMAQQKCCGGKEGLKCELTDKLNLGRVLLLLLVLPISSSYCSKVSAGVLSSSFQQIMAIRNNM